jgi:outer membrane immunogenic protein
MVVHGRRPLMRVGTRGAGAVCAALAAHIGICGTSTLAADLVLKAPPPIPAYSWTGYYAGLNAGGGWGGTIDNRVTSNDCLGPLLCPAFIIPLNASVPAQFDTHPRGFIGGGQFGHSWQRGAFVWGIETDFQGTAIEGDATAVSAGRVAIPAPTGFITVTSTGSQKIDWLGTLRGRLGWLPVNSLLVYATGGLAYGHVRTDVSFSGQNPGPAFAISQDGITAASLSDTRAGWTVGGGAEWMFAPHWSLKAEYLRYDLGSVTVNQALTLTGFVSPPVVPTSVGANVQSDANYRGNIARFGVNYKFD